jgi:phosphoribosylanthranilate isomerase
MIPVKICGLTRAEDALLAAELGAAAIGFVFYPRSPRYIAASDAARISAQLPPPLARVGVFVDPEPETMIATARLAQLTHIQLHGEESLALCRRSPLPVIKAIRTWDDLRKYESFPMAAFLIDSKSQKQFGGTGPTRACTRTGDACRRHFDSESRASDCFSQAGCPRSFQLGGARAWCQRSSQAARIFCRLAEYRTRNNAQRRNAKWIFLSPLIVKANSTFRINVSASAAVLFRRF